MGEKVIFLVKEANICCSSPPLVYAGFGHVDPLFTNPYVYFTAGGFDKTCDYT